MKRQIDLEKLVSSGKFNKETIQQLKEMSFKQEHFNSTSLWGTFGALMISAFLYKELFTDSGAILYALIFFSIGILLNLFFGEKLKIFANSCVIIGAIGCIIQVNQMVEDSTYISLLMAIILLIVAFITEKVSLCFFGSIFLINTVMGQFLDWQSLVILLGLGIGGYAAEKYVPVKMHNTWMWFSRIQLFAVNWILWTMSMGIRLGHSDADIDLNLGHISHHYYAIIWAVLSIGSIIYATKNLLSSLHYLSMFFLLVNYSIQFFSIQFITDMEWSSQILIYGISLIIFGFVSSTLNRMYFKSTD